MERINFFTKSETKIIVSILVVLFVVVGFNMSISLRRGRDNLRKNDMSVVQKALDSYLKKYGSFPPSENGRIKGCFNEEVKLDKKTGKPTNMVICNWGGSSFENISTMPRDPQSNKGAEYLYISDTESYEIYIALEGKDEAEYNKDTESLGLKCGSRICNYGRRY